MMLFLLGFVAVVASKNTDYCFGGADPRKPIEVPSVPDGYELKTVQVVTRHGARTALFPLKAHGVPWNCTDSTEMSLISLDATRAAQEQAARMYRFEYLDDREILPGNCLTGQLTSLGSKQHRSIGQGLRKALVTDTNFLNDNSFREQIYVRSTEVPRVQQSAESQLLALFPPPTAASGDVHVLPIHLVDQDKDDMTPNWKQCPHLVNYKAEIWSTDSPRQRAALQAIKNITDVKKLIEKVFNDTEDPTASFPDEWLTQYADTFHTMDCHNMSLPAEITPQIRQRLYAAVDTFWDLLWSYNKLSVTGLGQFLTQDFNQQFQVRVNNPDAKDPVFYLFSGHDTTVAPLLGALRAYDGVWPPLASNIVFQLLRNQQDQSFAVRMVYNGQTISPEPCNTTLTGGIAACSWAEWSKLMNDTAANYQQYSSLCKQSNPSPTPPPTNGPSDTGAAGGGGTWRVAFLATAAAAMLSWVSFFVMWRRSQKRGGAGHGYDYYVDSVQQ